MLTRQTSFSRLHSVRIADQTRIPSHVTTQPLALSLFTCQASRAFLDFHLAQQTVMFDSSSRFSTLGLLIRTFFFDILKTILSLPLPLIFTTTTATTTTTTTSTSLAFANEDTGRYQQLTHGTSELLEPSFTNLASADNFEYLSAFVRWPLDTCWHPRGAGSIH